MVPFFQSLSLLWPLAAGSLWTGIRRGSFGATVFTQYDLGMTAAGSHRYERARRNFKRCGAGGIRHMAAAVKQSEGRNGGCQKTVAVLAAL
jgi:hypothetical protein